MSVIGTVILMLTRLFSCFCAAYYSNQRFSEDDHQLVIEYMQELTGRQLDCDVIEMILSESDWKGNQQLELMCAVRL